MGQKVDRTRAALKGGRGTEAPRRPGSASRGRPPKFGRRSQVVALTLPQDVLDSLRTLHPDPGWAIVQLVESTLRDGAVKRPPNEATALAELAHLPGKRGLILVQPKLFKRLPGVSTLPLADGRAFLAFDQAHGLADLEVAILDTLEGIPPDSGQHAQLMQIRDILRAWRRDPGLTFKTKSIIVVEGTAAVQRRPLAPPREIAR